MKNIFYALTTISLLAACNNSGSSGPALSLEDSIKQAAPAEDITSKITPEVFTVIKANLNETEALERYSLGCKKAGESESAEFLMDPKLSAGQLFKTEFAMARLQSDLLDLITESTITAVAANEISAATNYEKFNWPSLPFSSPQEIFLSKPHLVEKITFTKTDSGGYNSNRNSINTDSNLTARAREFFLNSANRPPHQYVSCSLVYTADNLTPQTSKNKISYNLNGKQVVAYLYKWTSKGKIKCSSYTSVETGENADKPDLEVDMGDGISESSAIYSNESIELGPATCGGSRLYESSKLTLDSGKIVGTFVTKILNAPVR